MGVVSEAEYEGNPVLILKNSEEDKYPFRFGLKKARLMLEHVEDIKEFVKKHGEEGGK